MFYGDKKTTDEVFLLAVLFKNLGNKRHVFDAVNFIVF
jgi:hypothetical protein